MEYTYVSLIFVIFSLFIFFRRRKNKIFHMQNDKQSVANNFHFFDKKQIHEDKNKISIMTYNILCQKFMKRKDRKDLNLDKRMNIVLHEIKSLNPDIICLQEVNLFSFKKYFLKNLEQYSFEYGDNYGSPFINLIGYKKNKFQRICFKNLDLSNINCEGNRGVFNLVLGDKANGLKYSIFNVHFPWKPIYEIEKALILNNIAEFILKNEIERVFLVGDFNSLPNSIVLRMVYFDEFLKEIQLYNIDPNIFIRNVKNLICKYQNVLEIKQNYIDCRNKKEIYIFDRYVADLSLMEVFPLMLKNMHELFTKYHFKSCYDDYQNINSNNFNSNNFSYLKNHPKFTNYTHNFKETIDYIFYSKNLKPIKLLILPSEEEVSREQFLPSSKYPSDHIKLYSEFLI